MILRVLICIPTYNNATSIGQVVSEALQETDLSVLVVDDGSDTPVAPLLKSPDCTEGLRQERLHVIRLEQNQGKGAALQSAFKWAVKRGYTHLLTVDGDGQHLLAEAKKLLAEALKNPFALIVGKRKFEGENIPGASVFGRKFSNFWVGYQTGRIVEDSQSGYRLYPLFHVQNRRFICRRYDFEIEVLIRLIWDSIPVREVEIEVYYPPPEERVSHFNKLWDNVRISLLNTLLVILTLLRHNLTPGKSAAAIGVGVFVGSTPFFGLQTAIGTALAFILRLNAVLVFLGTNVSMPPISLILIPAEIACGRYYLPHANPLGQWLFGALLVGSGLGILAAAFTYFAAHHMQKRKAKAANWTGKTRGGRLGNGFLKWVLKLLGRRAGYFCLLFVVPYFYLFAPRARRAMNEYWLTREPQASFWRHRYFILRQFYRFGQVLMDRVYQSFHEKPFRVEAHGLEHILTPVRQRQPLVLVTAHAGGWDLAAALLRQDGLWGEFHMVHYQFSGLTLDNVFGIRERTPHVQSLITNQDPILEIKLRLEKAQPVGFMGDRASDSHYEMVSFLGKIAAFDARPFRIAATCNSPLLITFGFRKGDGVYDLYAEPAQVFAIRPGEDRAAQIRDWVQSYADTLARHLQAYPEQWFNFYPFFSSPPKSPPGIPNSLQRHSLEQPWRKQAQAKPESEPVPTTNAETKSPSSI